MESRLELGNQVEAIQLYGRYPTAYIHVVQLNQELLQAISKEVHAAFGVDLIIQWGGGKYVAFHVGDDPPRTTENDRVSTPYVKAVNASPAS